MVFSMHCIRQKVVVNSVYWYVVFQTIDNDMVETKM